MHEKVLKILVLWRNDATNSQIAEILRRELVSNYRDDSGLINFEAFRIGLRRVDSSRPTEQHDLIYDNLYTYVVLDGIIVPYYHWVYEKEFRHGNRVYKFDSAARQVKVYSAIKIYDAEGFEQETLSLT